MADSFDSDADQLMPLTLIIIRPCYLKFYKTCLSTPADLRDAVTFSLCSLKKRGFQDTDKDNMHKSRSFENSCIPENPRTPKPLTFSKNRLRGAKNRSNISPVAKNNFRKNDFFFSKNFAYVQTFFLCIRAQFFVLFQNRSKTRKVLLKKIEKKRKKKVAHMQKFKKKVAHMQKLKKNIFNHYERFGGSQSRFFERNNGGSRVVLRTAPLSQVCGYTKFSDTCTSARPPSTLRQKQASVTRQSSLIPELNEPSEVECITTLPL
ncbi:hypothetical protein LXL04_020411 [Taraxacum kok-saghyz]